MKLLKKINIFGNDFKLNLKGDIQYRTWLGGVFTILLLLSTLTLIWYFGQDIYLRQSPTYQSKTLFKNETPMIDLNTTNFFFSIRIEDDNGYAVDNRKYFDYFMYYDYYQNSKGIYTSIKSIRERLVLCNTTHLNNDTLIKKLGLDTYYCYDIKGLKFGGDWQEAYIANPNWVIKRCNQDTEKFYNLTCATPEEQKNFYKRLYVDFYTFETNVNPKNYENPVEYFYKYHYIDFDLNNVTTTTRFYYSISTVTSNTGVIFDDKYSKDFLNLDDIKTSTIQGIYGDIIVKLGLLMTNKNTVFGRIYIKIPELAAQVGGILSLVMPFIDVIYKFFIDNEYSVHLFYLLFRVYLDDDTIDNNFKHMSIDINKDNNKNRKNGEIELDNLKIEENNTSNVHLNKFNLHNEKMLPLPLNNNDNNISVTKKSKLKDFKKDKEIVLNKEIDKVINYKSKKLKIIQLTRCDLFKFKYCCGLRKAEQDIRYKLVHILRMKLVEKCDFTEIAKLLDQFSLYKKLTLNYGQCALLNNRDLKIITEKTSIIRNKQEEDVYEEDTKKVIFEYIRQRNESGTLNKTDKALIKYLPKYLSEELNIR